MQNVGERTKRKESEHVRIHDSPASQVRCLESRNLDDASRSIFAGRGSAKVGVFCVEKSAFFDRLIAASCEASQERPTLPPGGMLLHSTKRHETNIGVAARFMLRSCGMSGHIAVDRPASGAMAFAGAAT